MPTRRRVAGRVILTLSTLALIAGVTLILYTLLQGLSAPVPQSKSLTLTVPAMKRVDDLPVYDAAPSGYEGALRKSSVHVKGTGWPWQEEANVYIAGHRLGFPGTRSYLVFHDIDRLEDGDEIFLTDANGTRYIYEVYDELTFGPDEVRVLKPLAGRNIVTLQSCTLPDYARRIAVRAELTDVKEAG